MELNRENFTQLNHKKIPISASHDVQFSYEDITYTIGRIRLNESSGGLMTSLSWRINDIEYSANGIGIQTGVDIVKQYDTKLPSLVAININERGMNVTKVEDLRMYIILEFDKYFLGL